MNCPRCGLGMRSGLAIIKMKPALLPVLAGVGMNGYQHLWFVSPDVTDTAAVRMAAIDGSGDLVLKVGRTQTAERCQGCGLVVLLTGESG